MDCNPQRCTLMMDGQDLDEPSQSKFQPSAQDAFTDMLNEFRVKLAEVMKEREESFRKLERGLTSTAKEIHTAQERNTALTQKIIQLDAWIEEEKQKWKEALENERRMLQTKSVTPSHATPRS
jgi:hypothetical protein